MNKGVLPGGHCFEFWYVCLFTCFSSYLMVTLSKLLHLGDIKLLIDLYVSHCCEPPLAPTLIVLTRSARQCARWTASTCVNKINLIPSSSVFGASEDHCTESDDRM